MKEESRKKHERPELKTQKETRENKVSGQKKSGFPRRERASAQVRERKQGGGAGLEVTCDLGKADLVKCWGRKLLPGVGGQEVSTLTWVPSDCKGRDREDYFTEVHGCFFFSFGKKQEEMCGAESPRAILVGCYLQPTLCQGTLWLPVLIHLPFILHCTRSLSSLILRWGGWRWGSSRDTHSSTGSSHHPPCSGMSSWF